MSNTNTVATSQSIVPKPRFPEFWDARPWEEKYIEDLFELLPTANNSRGDLSTQGDIQYVHYGDIHTKYYNVLNLSDTPLPKIPAKLHKNATFLQNGDLIIADASEDTNGIGKAIEVAGVQNTIKVISGLHILPFRNKPNIYAPRFKGFLFESDYYKSQVRGHAVGTKVYAISKSTIRKIRVLLIAMQEQEKIIFGLGSLDQMLVPVPVLQAAYAAEPEVAEAIPQLFHQLKASNLDVIHRVRDATFIDTPVFEDFNLKRVQERKQQSGGDDFHHTLGTHTCKLVPKLRFPEFRDTAAWNMMPLHTVCKKIVQGGTPDTSNPNYWNGTINWLTPAEMGTLQTRFVNSTTRKITQEGLQKCSSDLLPIHSLIISTRAPIGYLAINTVPMAINQGCKGLIPSDSLHYDFLYFTLLHFKQSLADLGAGNTFKELSSSTLKNFVISVPNIREQEKITACLGSLDELIGAEQEKLAALRQHKQGLMQQLFPADGETIPRLRFPEFEGERPWEVQKLEDFAELYKGKGISKTDIDVNGQIPCIRYGELYTIYGEIINTVVSKTNLPPSSLFLSKRNDIIIPSSGETKIDIATASCVLDDNIALGSDLNIIRTTHNGVFLSYYLNGQKKEEIAKIAQGDTVVHLYSSQLKLLLLGIPSAEEQQKIADCLAALDEQINQQAQKIEALQQHKKGLMQQLFPTTHEPKEPYEQPRQQQQTR